jgi:excisionase family DNA binding protein
VTGQYETLVTQGVLVVKLISGREIRDALLPGAEAARIIRTTEDRHRDNRDGTRRFVAEGRPTTSVIADEILLTPHEAASLLRTSRKAIYTMVERAAIPGAVRIGRRLLFQRETLLDWLRQKSASSLERPTR